MAGSWFAKGDTLLLKLVPDLQKLGERMPIISKLEKKVVNQDYKNFLLIIASNIENNNKNK